MNEAQRPHTNAHRLHDDGQGIGGNRIEMSNNKRMSDRIGLGYRRKESGRLVGTSISKRIVRKAEWWEPGRDEVSAS